MTARNIPEGDELYQDTMLTLLEQRNKLDTAKNIKSYALSVSIFLWKNKTKKFAWRKRLAKLESYDKCLESGNTVEFADDLSNGPENRILQKEQIHMLRNLVGDLPDKYSRVIYLYYSANMKITEIADCLHIPESTVKSRMRKAKSILKKKLEVANYDR